jgi:hypothetical protein
MLKSPFRKGRSDPACGELCDDYADNQQAKEGGIPSHA